MFFRDPTSHDTIWCKGFTHNAAGDYKNTPNFVGYTKIEVDLSKLTEPRKD